jgi:hypothetical protein
MRHGKDLKYISITNIFKRIYATQKKNKVNNPVPCDIKGVKYD